jgi:hypothetical protein
MSSPLDVDTARDRRDRKAADTFIAWNRRTHYFIGLYLLFFCWLFVLTGLLLNHTRWEFAQFWPNRIQNTTEHQLQLPNTTSNIERARGFMRQLGIVGEIQWPAGQTAGGIFVFQATRPGLIVDVKVDLDSGRATLQRNELNAWGVMNLLHTFTGVRAADTINTRDWMLTTIWALTMDAVAAGLIVMVFSSYLMWYRLKSKRRGGAVALVLGLVGCGAFVFGLSWLS